MQDLDSGDLKRRVHLFETQRRTKEEDPIIPFSDGPIISKWGAISRSSRTGYHTTDPVQATASQGSATKPISVSGNPFNELPLLIGSSTVLLNPHFVRHRTFPSI